MQSLLVVQLKRLGDLVLTTPALSVLRRLYPEAQITLLIDRCSRALTPAIAQADRIWVYRGTESIWMNLLKTRFDLCLDFTGNDRSALVSILSKAPRRVGFRFLTKRPARRWAYNCLVMSPVREKHTVDHYLDLVGSLGSVESDADISLRIPEQTRNSVALLRENLPLPDNYFLLHPGSAKTEKYWMAERWAEVIAYARERFNLPCIITGGQDPAELQHVEGILSCSSNHQTIFNLTGKIDLLATAALIERAAFFLGVDTVAAHFAAAFHRPSITLFGPTNPFHWRARHAGAIALRAGQPGQIQYFDPRQKGAPMSQLSTDVVIHAMENLLKGAR